MKYGRVDVSGPEQCPEEGRLPGKYTFDVYRIWLGIFYHGTYIKQNNSYRAAVCIMDYS